MENTYKIKVFCTNCDFTGEINIPKGQTVEQTSCENCGTPNLIKNQDVFISNNSEWA